MLVTPRACVPASASTSYTRSSSEGAGLLAPHSRVFARPAPHSAAHAFRLARLALRRGDETASTLPLCSRPCSSHLPRTGPRLSLGVLGVCDWPGLRSLQLGEARRTAAAEWTVAEACLRHCGTRGGRVS